MLAKHRLKYILTSSTKVAINSISVRTNFTNKYRHGPTRKSNPRFDYAQSVKDFFRGGGVTFAKEMYTDIKDELNRRLFRGYSGVDYDRIDIFEHFDNDEFLKKWKTRADADSDNGFSTAQLTRSEAGHALFKGYVDNQIPDDGLTMNSGFTALIGPRHKRTVSIGPQRSWDWRAYNSLEIKYRGDGRKYTLVINTADWNNDLAYYDLFFYPLHTRGGPFWETKTIPFSKFIFAYKGLVQHNQAPFFANTVKFVAITLNDKIDGPFSLEIDYIGLEKKSLGIREESAYEGYNFDHIRFKQVAVGVDPPDDN